MNVLITLPKHLIDKIISGEKKYEMRKCLPKYMRIGEDGFFVVEKGTDNIRCWCRVDEVRGPCIGPFNSEELLGYLGVPREYIEKYVKRNKFYLWKIGKVITFDCFKTDPLLIKKNPQQFAYYVLSPGDWF